MKLASSSKLEIGTYIADKIKVIGSCTLLVVHPDTQCLKEVTFHVTSHEGNVVLSCVTTLDLCLIEPHTNLDSISSNASLVTSKADYPRKKKSQKHMLDQSPRKMSVQARNSLIYYRSLRNTMLICVLYKKKQMEQASGSAKPMLFLWKITRTFNLIIV